MRDCEICHTSKKEIIFTQYFLLPEEDKSFHYKIVRCKKCGFIFADEIPSQDEYNRYYELNSRYVYKNYDGRVPEATRRVHEKYFSILEDYLKNHLIDINKKKTKILDVGCATGYFLSLFKEKGFPQVLGIEPAKECSSIAKKFYDIEVLNIDLASFSKEDKYDIIILNAVMEHIIELAKAMDRIKSIIADRGLIYIVVPDAENFAQTPVEPFYEFSLEHVNYFTIFSLKNLLGKYGFELKSSEFFKGEHPDSAILSSIWQLNSQTNIVADKIGNVSVRTYIKKSSRKLRAMKIEIEKIVQTQEKIIIWGCGSFTSRLLATTNLLEANIIAFIDSRENLQNKSILGIGIKNPDYLIGKKEAILIGSVTSGVEITNILKNKYHYEGKILLF